jgi:hypothetical protein
MAAASFGAGASRLSGLNERQALELQVILNTSKTSAESLKVQR